MSGKTIKEVNVSEFLRTCDVDDIISARELSWKIQSKYEEKGKMIVVAHPFNDATDFEIWSCGLECHVTLPLEKVSEDKL